MLEYVVFNQAGQAPSYVPTLAGENTFTGRMIIRPTVDSANIFQVQSADGTQCFEVDTSHQWVKVGPDQPIGNLDPQVTLYITKNTNMYHAVNLQNTNSGEYASTDFVILNDIAAQGSELGTTGYLDLGVNSSGWADPDYATFDASCEYLDFADNFYFGCSGATGSLYFYFGGHNDKAYIKACLDQTGNFNAVSFSNDAGVNKWMFGGAGTGTLVADAVNYLAVTVNGTPYKLALVTG